MTNQEKLDQLAELSTHYDTMRSWNAKEKEWYKEMNELHSSLPEQWETILKKPCCID